MNITEEDLRALVVAIDAFLYHERNANEYLTMVKGVAKSILRGK